MMNNDNNWDKSHIPPLEVCTSVARRKEDAVKNRTLLTSLLLFVFVVPSLWASEWDQETKLTFNRPVELPGVSLPAGTYTFTIMPDVPERNIVQIWNADRTKLYTTVLAVPDYRLHSSDKPVLVLDENSAGNPQEIKAWFYPGDQYGHEFVYPKSQARRIAKSTHEPVLYVPDAMSANMKEKASSANQSSVTALRNAPVRAVGPSGQDVNTGVATTNPTSNASKSLPTNSSNQPQ
jgi:hypothetical protein